MPDRAPADLDDDLVARALRWCAEASRPCSASDVRAALSPLTWDELLAARALLADPPPARPLGPGALADLARGRPVEEAAAREEEGLYGEAGPPEVPPAEGAPARGRRKPRSGLGPRPAGPVIHRARDREEPGVRLPAALPSLDLLFAPAGRAELERLLREHGARRAPILAALAAGFARGDGSAPGEVELDALLETHGLARGFAHRERDELLHALRAAGGVRARAAAAVGLSPEALAAALARLGAGDEAEAVRAAHREELRRRATLAERTRLVIAERERLEDLCLLEELEGDLRTRIPVHLRALRASTRDTTLLALARSLSVGPDELAVVLRRIGLDLDLGPAASRPERPATRPAFTRAVTASTGFARPGAARSGLTRTGAARSGAPRIAPAGAARPGPTRSGPARPAPTRPGPPRPGAARSGSPRSGATPARPAPASAAGPGPRPGGAASRGKARPPRR